MNFILKSNIDLHAYVHEYFDHVVFMSDTGQATYAYSGTNNTTLWASSSGTRDHAPEIRYRPRSLGTVEAYEQAVRGCDSASYVKCELLVCPVEIRPYREVWHLVGVILC